MKITRRQLNNLVRESIDRDRLVRYIANELANRAFDMGILDDINDVDPDALDFTLPEVLVSRLGPDPSQEQWSGLAKAIAQGTYDSDLAAIADPEEDEAIQESKIEITREKLRQIIQEELEIKDEEDIVSQLTKLFDSEKSIFSPQTKRREGG